MVDDKSAKQVPPIPRAREVEQQYQQALARLEQNEREYDESVAPVMAKIEAWGDEGYARHEQQKRDREVLREESLAAFQASMDEIAADLDQINGGDYENR